MLLRSLQLIQFKNYPELRLKIDNKINLLLGKNGSGKTNLLDAIHYLSLTRSAFASADTHCVAQGEEFFSIKGLFESKGDSNEVFCYVQSGSKKIIRENQQEVQKMSEHVGKYPVVLAAPDDTDLVREGSEPRRKFFDSLFSQLDRAYMESLIAYNNALKQRNGLLKWFAEQQRFDAIALESYDELLAAQGQILFQKRKFWIAQFLPFFRQYYRFIVEDEDAGLEYKSDLASRSMREGLEMSRERDKYLQRTSFGIHRDDYIFSLGSGDLKRLGSQGQQKSFVIGLRLAQFELMKNKKGFKPILLLDDIFDKLDDHRIGKLLDLIKSDEFGQLFLTDARPDRTTQLLQDSSIEADSFLIDKGKIAQS